MRVSVQCKTCKTPHFDHFECSECHTYIIENTLPHWQEQKRWKYCPYCGARLYQEQEESNVRNV